MSCTRLDSIRNSGLQLLCEMFRKYLTVPALHLRGGVLHCAALCYCWTGPGGSILCDVMHILHVGNIFVDSQHKHAWILYLEFLVGGVLNVQSIALEVIPNGMSSYMLSRFPSF